VGSVRTRRIEPTDGQRLKDLLHALSEESRFLRFLANIRDYSPAQLDRFTNVDYTKDMALAATVGDGPEEEIIGVARYMLLPKGQTAEFALVVRDDFQNQGIGSRLMRELIQVAAHRGLKQLEGYVLGTNPGMLQLMAHLGFRIETDPQDPSMRRAVKSL
jgi:acetyltransferase